MSVELEVNGQTFDYPEVGDVTWGADATDWAVAVTEGMLQKAGGLFLLLDDVDFGANYGLISTYFTSRTTNSAAAGALRLANADTVSWRNAANSGDLALAVNGANKLTFNGTVLQQGEITVSDTATIDLTLSGGTALTADIRATSIDNSMISNAAAIAYSKLALTGSIVNADVSASAAIDYLKLNLTGSIVNADVNASAAIAYSKLALTGSLVNADVSASAAIARSKIASGSASHVVINDGSGVLSSEAQLDKTRGGTGISSTATFPASGTVATVPSSGVVKSNGSVLSASNVALTSEVSGVLPVANGGTNSSTALNNNRVMQSSGGAIIEAAAITASRALVSDANGIPTHSATTATELGFVSGVTSAIQTQLNTKAPTASPTFTGTITTPLTASRAVVTGASSDLAASSVTATELGYLSGVTSSVQTQINAVNSSASTSYELSNLGIACSVSGNALTIALKQSDGSSDASVANPVSIAFGSTTATSGSYTRRSVTSSLSITVPSGATLGHTNGNAHYIYVYAIDDSGTVTLGVSQVSRDEGTTNTTTAINTSSDAASGFYSASAHTSKRVRLIARLKSTQTTAGTWAVVPQEQIVAPCEIIPIIANYAAEGDTINDNSATALVFDVLTGNSEDTVAGMNTSTGVYTVQKTSKYFIFAQISAALNVVTGNSWQIQVLIGGNIRAGSIHEFSASNTNNAQSLSTSGVFSLSAGDTITVRALINGNAASYTATSGVNASRVSISEVL